MSKVPPDFWLVLELFWMCHIRVPGFSMWGLNRTHYPNSGSAVEQDHWLMWAFGVIEGEFYQVQSEQSEEQSRAQQLKATHEKIKREQHA